MVVLAKLAGRPDSSIPVQRPQHDASRVASQAFDCLFQWLSAAPAAT